MFLVAPCIFGIAVVAAHYPSLDVTCINLRRMIKAADYYSVICYRS